MKRAWVVILWALLATAAAQDAPAPEPDATADPQAQDATAAPAQTPAPAAAAGTAKSPDSFVPSEEISEDLSVSFPVDI